VVLLTTGYFLGRPGRSAEPCPTVNAPEVRLGVSTDRGVAGNPYPVTASVQIGEHVWVAVNEPPSVVHYPAISYPADSAYAGGSLIYYPDTTSPELRRVCTLALAHESRGLFLAQGVGVAEVDVQPRSSRGPMLVYRAQITVVGRSVGSCCRRQRTG
jgi:hypothetical protein